MQIITHLDSQCNIFNQRPNNRVYTPNLTPDAVYQQLIKPQREWLPQEHFDKANTYRRAWIAAVIQECGLRGNETKVIEALTFCADPTHGIGDPSIWTIKEKILEQGGGHVSYSTVRENLDRIASKGAIQKQHRPNRSSIFKLIGYKLELEHVLESLSLDSVSDLPLPTSYKEDLNTITQYDEYVSQQTKEKRYRKSTNSKKSVDEKAFISDPEAEIKRFCLLFTLTELQTAYTLQAMRETSAKNKPGFLYAMVNGIKGGTWNMKDFRKQETATNYKARSDEATKETLGNYDKQLNDWEKTDKAKGLDILKGLRKGLRH